MPPITANAMADDFGPKLVVMLEAKKPEIVKSAGGLAARLAVKLAWSLFLAWVPWLVARAIEYAADRWGRMTINELVASIDHVRLQAEYRPNPTRPIKLLATTLAEMQPPA